MAGEFENAMDNRGGPVTGNGADHKSPSRAVVARDALPSSEVNSGDDGHHSSHPNHLQDSGALYLVFCGIYDQPYTPERYARDMTWAGTVKDIADRQFGALRQVIEIGTGRDVTAEMLAEASVVVEIDAPLTGQDKIEWLNDHRRDQRKPERV